MFHDFHNKLSNTLRSEAVKSRISLATRIRATKCHFILKMLYFNINLDLHGFCFAFKENDTLGTNSLLDTSLFLDKGAGTVYTTVTHNGVEFC